MGEKIETYENGELVSTVDTRTLDEVKTIRKNEINDYRSLWISQGFEYEGNVFDTDAQSLSNIYGMATAAAVAAPWPSNFTWRDHNNNDVLFSTPAEFVVFATVLMNYVNNCYKKSWAAKAEIDSLLTIEEVELYDITANWPDNFYFSG